MKTTRKMAPVTASTNRDSPKIDLAGVDTGAKIFVGLGVVSPKAVAAAQPQTRICEPGTYQFVEPRGRNWFPQFGLIESEQSQNLTQLVYMTPMTLSNLCPPGEAYASASWNPGVEIIPELPVG